MKKSDVPTVLEIYAYGLETRMATFETKIPAWVQLAQKCGFRKVGIREKLACPDGVWRDTLIMERRSKAVGV